MRGNIALASLLTAGLLVAASPATPAGAATGTLPEDLDGGVVVDLADGDRFKAYVSRDLRTVWGSRYDAATRSWSARAVVFKEKDVFCGDVDARAAGMAVALIAQCDEGGYSEDTAPTHSQAIYSPDTVTWSAFTLPGEAYEEPGISPSGTNAIWPLHHGWATYGPGGFRAVQRELPGQEYTITGTVSDAGDVSVLYGGSQVDGRDCALSVLTIAATGAASEQHFDLRNACGDVGLANLDANTVLFGENGYPEDQTTISRPDTASPWAVTGIAPSTAPGLVRHRGRGTATTLFVTSPGLPMLAVGSPDQRRFYAQAYDLETQRWGTSTEIGATPGCTWGDNFIQEPLGVFALRLECGKRNRVLVSVDGTRWSDLGLERTPLGISPDGHYVSVSNRARTQVFSRERGMVRLPVGARGRCDVVQPVSADAAIRLTTSSDRGWPSRLEVSSASGWRRTSTSFPGLRVGSNVCERTRAEVYEHPVSYTFLGSRRAVALTVVTDGDGFRVRKTVY